MSLRFLLDTNVLSEPLKPAPDAGVMQHLREYRHELATATLVWHELLYGCYSLPSSTRRTAIEQYLSQVVALLPMFPYDEAAVAWHARERARLVSLGKTPAFVDNQIAAIAQANHLTLITANVADYIQFDGLNVVNWMQKK